MKNWSTRLTGQITKDDLIFKKVYEQNVAMAAKERNPDFLQAPWELYKATRAPKGLGEEGTLESYKSYLRRIGAVEK